jgi:hypothetical protein
VVLLDNGRAWHDVIERFPERRFWVASAIEA